MPSAKDSRSKELRLIDAEVSIDRSLFANEVNTISSVMKELEDLRGKYGPNAEMRLDSGYDSISILLKHTRLESDPEYNARIREETRVAKARLVDELEERKELKRLLKKYGEAKPGSVK